MKNNIDKFIKSFDRYFNNFETLWKEDLKNAVDESIKDYSAGGLNALNLFRDYFNHCIKEYLTDEKDMYKELLMWEYEND